MSATPLQRLLGPFSEPSRDTGVGLAGVGSVLPVETTIDSLGRIVVPKVLRDAVGLTPGRRST